MQKITDGGITLIEDIHKYKLEADPEFEFTSCTTFVKYFFEPFDKIGIANGLTATHPKYTHLTPQELVAEWDEIASLGTFIHAEVENYLINRSAPTHPKSIIAAEWIDNNIFKNDRFDCYPELIVYSKELALAGTIDLLLYDKTDSSYKIIDWKTNKKIETESFRNKMGLYPATSKLMDCNYNHYAIQLSLYKYLLETYYGIEVTGTAIAHLTDNGVKSYKTEYFNDEIKEMLNADRSVLKKYVEENMTSEYL